MWFLFFSLLVWYITFIVFWILKPSLHPWDKSHFITVYDPFNVFLNSVCTILLMIYYLCSSVMLAHKFCVQYLCLVLISGLCWPHNVSLEAFLPLQFFGIL